LEVAVPARRFVAEFIGTFMLVFLAVGAAVSGIGATAFPGSGILGVAIAFGFVQIATAYAFGPVSGAHINPAVTLGMLVARKIDAATAGVHWLAQCLGAIVGAGLLKLFVSQWGVKDQTGGLGTNDYGLHISMAGAFVLEVVLTLAFVLTILLVTDRAAVAGAAGLAIGVALTAVHLVAIPLDGTSVNPARSLGPALFEGGEPLAHLWLFIVAPLVGGLLAALIYPFSRLPERPMAVDPHGERAAA
jgi:aquaporin Z